jgi:hypothetical protein
VVLEIKGNQNRIFCSRSGRIRSSLEKSDDPLSSCRPLPFACGFLKAATGFCPCSSDISWPQLCAEYQTFINDMLFVRHFEKSAPREFPNSTEQYPEQPSCCFGLTIAGDFKTHQPLESNCHVLHFSLDLALVVELPIEAIVLSKE